MGKAIHHWSVRVYYEDTDAGGIVYHANYLRFLERGRTEWLRDLGFEQDKLQEQNLIFVVQRMDIHFVKPAFFNQQLSVHTQLVQLRRASMTMKQIITNQQQAEILCADVTVACVSLDKHKPCRLPAAIVGELTRVI